VTQHLGTWVSALVDGQFGPADTERALAHVAGCRECAAELAAARQARRALSVVRDVEPAPDLTARLIALASAPPRGVGPPGPARARPVVPLGISAYASPARALSGDVTTRRPAWFRLVAASLGCLGVVATGLFLLGDRPPIVPTAHPAEALSMLGRATGPGATAAGTLAPDLAAQISHATTSGSSGVRAGAVLDWMRGAGWTAPADIPTGYEVTAARLTGDGDALLELDLAGPDGRIVLTEQRGRLDAAAFAVAPERAFGDRVVYVLTRQPWHAVWQSGDTVVSIVSEASAGAVGELVAGFPAAGYDDGLWARLARGWDTVTGAFPHP